MVKLAWQLLSLSSDQSVGQLLRLPSASTHRAAPGALAAAMSPGCQHCQWGNTLQLRHSGAV